MLIKIVSATSEQIPLFPSKIIWILFVFTILILLVFYYVLDYHWKKYGFGIETINRNRKIFILGSGFFSASSLVFAILFEIFK